MKGSDYLLLHFGSSVTVSKGRPFWKVNWKTSGFLSSEWSAGKSNHRPLYSPSSGWVTKRTDNIFQGAGFEPRATSCWGQVVLLFMLTSFALYSSPHFKVLCSNLEWQGSVTLNYAISLCSQYVQMLCGAQYFSGFNAHLVLPYAVKCQHGLCSFPWMQEVLGNSQRI